ncbi:suppressor of tub2 mutation [Allomyces javanicus]|nr:suppressor of tub2 mutation [Allomyces javanicus]
MDDYGHGARRRNGSNTYPASPRAAESGRGGGTAGRDMGAIPLTSPRDADREFDALAAVLAGKETESNWEKREDALRRLKGLMKSSGLGTNDGWSADQEIADAVAAGLRRILDDFLACSLSLRTALVVTACAALTEVCLALGHALDTMAEPIVTTMLKLLGSTKKLVHMNGATALASLLVSVTLKPRIMDKLTVNMDDRNMQIRTYAITLVYEILLALKDALAAGEDLPRFPILDYVEKSIRKGVADQNPQVREVSRDCFWILDKIDKQRANSLLNKFDANTRKIIQRGPSGKPRPSMVPFRPPVARLARDSSVFSDDAPAPLSPSASSARLHSSLPSPSPSLRPLGPNYRTGSPVSAGGRYHYAAVGYDDDPRSGRSTPVRSASALSSSAAPGDDASGADTPTMDPAAEFQAMVAALDEAVAVRDSAAAADQLQLVLASYAFYRKEADDNPLAAEVLTADVVDLVRRAVTTALSTADDELVAVALDDPPLLWQVFSSAAADGPLVPHVTDTAVAVELVVAVVDAWTAASAARSPVQAHLADCRADGKRFWGSLWLTLLTRAMGLATADQARVLLGWVEHDPDLEAWAAEFPDEMARFEGIIKQLAPSPVTRPGALQVEDVQDVEDGEGDAGRANGTARLPSPLDVADEGQRPPPAHDDDGGDQGAPQDGDAVPFSDDAIADLAAAMAAHRVTVVELYRFAAYVQAHAGALDIASVAAALEQLVTYALSAPATADNDDTPAETLQTVAQVTSALGPRLHPTARAHLVDHAVTAAVHSSDPLSPTPATYWLDQALAAAVARPAVLPNAAVSAALAAARNGDPAETYWRLVVVDKLAPPADTETGVAAILARVLRARMPPLVRMLAVRVAARASDAALDVWVGDGVIEAAHARLVRAYVQRAAAAAAGDGA